MTMTPTTRVVCSQVRPLVLSLAVGTHGRSTAEKLVIIATFYSKALASIM